MKNKSERYTFWYQYSVGTYYNGKTMYNSDIENFETLEGAEEFCDAIKQEFGDNLINWQITKYTEEIISNNENFDVKYEY